MSTQAAVELLTFDLKLVSGGWFCFWLYMFFCGGVLCVLTTGLRFRQLALRPELQRVPSGRPHPRGGLSPGGTPPGPAGVCEQLCGHDFPGRPVPAQTRLHREWVRVGLAFERFGLDVDGSTVGFVNSFFFLLWP